MKQCKTSLRLIEKAVSEKWVRSLALFHALKFKYNNSCIYSYKGRFKAISKELHLSMKSMYSYVKLLRSKGLIYDHSDNLIMKSFQVIRFELGGLWKKCTLIIPDSYNLFDIECLLYAKILEDHARKQANRVRLKEAGKIYGENPVRRNGGEDRRIKGLSETPFHASLSYRTVGKILNLSNNKAIKVIKNLNRLNVLNSKRQKPGLIMKNANWLNIDFLNDFPGYRFISAGSLFEQYGMEHEFIQFPIIVKGMTLRQFKKLNSNIL